VSVCLPVVRAVYHTFVLLMSQVQVQLPQRNSASATHVYLS